MCSPFGALMLIQIHAQSFTVWYWESKLLSTYVQKGSHAAVCLEPFVIKGEIGA